MKNRNRKKKVIPGFGLSFGIVMAILGLIVVIPLCSLVVFSSQLSFSEFIATVTRPRVLASYRVSILTAFIAAAINAVMGLAIAWVLVRYTFPWKRFMDGIIELPFALPTAVAGIALTHLTVSDGWIGRIFAKAGIKIAYTRIGITVALVFIGIPFVVRSVQPVLEKVEKEYEEAAALFGASRTQIFLHVILPLIYVIYTALREGFDTYVASVTDTYAVKAILLTVKVVIIAVAVNSVFGLFAAWLITKFQFRGKKIISTLIDLPLTISPIIAGLIFVLTFGRQNALYPYLKNWGIQIIFAVPGIVLATIFVTFPFISREIIPVLTSEGTDEEEAAALLGANGFRIFTQITFPHIKWAFLYGVVLCTARAMGEFGAVSVLSGHLRGITNTMPLYIELLYQAFDFTGAFAMSSILVVMALVILVVRNILEYRGKKESEQEPGESFAAEKKESAKRESKEEALA